jgi:hypothetical protein
MQSREYECIPGPIIAVAGLKAHVKEGLPVRSRIVRLSRYGSLKHVDRHFTHPDLVPWPICAWGRDSS